MLINYFHIGQRVREHRARQHLRQDTLAWEAEISVSYLSCIETGAKQASLGSIARIAEALGVTVDSLLFGEVECEECDELRDLHAVLSGCGEIELRIILDAVMGTAVAVKRSLRTNL